MTINARECTTRLADLLRREHAAMADFLLALADFDEKRLWVELGHSSLFYFLHRELGLSKGAAHYRMVAAGLVRRFPEIVEPLRDGRLCITSVIELARVISPENRDAVVPRFFHCSSREAKVISAQLRPREDPPRRDLVTVIPAPIPMQGSVAVTDPGVARPTLELIGSARDPEQQPTFALVQSIEPRADRDASSDQAADGAPPVAPSDDRALSIRREARDFAEPLTAELRRLHITVPAGFLEKLDAARAALSHSHATGTMGEILEAALDALLRQRAKRKGLVANPRRERRTAKPDHIPAAVKRAVWSRDSGCCQWPLESGGVCGSALRIEFDHVVPLARGGRSTERNIRLLCAMHNQLAARQIFGDAWMDRFRRPQPRTCS